MLILASFWGDQYVPIRRSADGVCAVPYVSAKMQAANGDRSDLVMDI